MKIQPEKFIDKAYDWIIQYGPGFIIGIIVLITGLWLIKLFAKWSEARMSRKQVNPSVRPFLMNLLATALRILLILGVMQIIGIKMTLFAALIGAFGVAAGLALSGTLQNFASGILILLLKPFAVGDNIITQGLEGTVTSIRIFYTIIKSYDNRDFIVPNSQLSNQVITNISKEGTRRLDISLKFTNNIDIKQVKSIINATIDKDENILANPSRRIGVGELQPDGYIIAINVWVNAHGFQDTKLAVQESILQDIKDAGVKIPGM